jgi:ABC-type lipoprotein release transport system permease subunit
MLVKLAWRNLWRNKRRSLITAAAIVFAVVLSILLDSVKKGLLDKMKENVVGFYTGYVQIHQQGYWDDQTLDNSFELQDVLLDKLGDHHRVTEVVPRLESFALSATEELSKGCMVVGIDPEKEKLVTSLDSKLFKGQYLNSSDRAVLLTEGLANYFGLGVKDTIVIIGQGYHGVTAAGKYPIKGLIKFGSPDLNKGLIYLPLKECQYLFGAENKITALVLQLDNVQKSNEVAQQLKANLSDQYEVMSWQQLLPELDQVIQGEEAENVIFQVVLYALIAFGIFGTILMMTIERQYEFGVLVAIGMKKHKLSLLVIIENVLLSVIGALAGIVVSIPVVFYLYKFPINLGGQLAEAYQNFGMEPIFYFSIEAVVFYTQALVVLSLALILSLYPLVKISSLNPVEAMQS